MERSNLLLIEKVLLLKSVSIFADTPENILAEIAHLLIDEQYDDNFNIFKEGDIGNCSHLFSKYG